MTINARNCLLFGINLGSLISAELFVDPYPQVFPNIQRPLKMAPTAAVFTGNPARGGGRRGWVDVEASVTESWHRRDIDHDGEPSSSSGPPPQPPPPESDAWARNDTIVQVGA